LPVIWSGLVILKLLRYRMTINEHAAAHDPIAGTIAGMSPGRAYEGVFACAPTTRLPGASPSPLSFRNGALS
jgi:hypothetical protein